MNHEQGQAFFDNIVKDVWNVDTGSADNLEKYYHKDLQAQFNHETAGFDDLVHRANFLRENFHKQRFQVKELLVDGDHLIVHMTYQAESKTSNDFGIAEHNEGIVIYTLRDGKVAKLVSFFQAPVNYAAGK